MENYDNIDTSKNQRKLEHHYNKDKQVQMKLGHHDNKGTSKSKGNLVTMTIRTPASPKETWSPWQ